MKSSKKEPIAGTLISEKQLPVSSVGQEATALATTNQHFLEDAGELAAGIIIRDGRILQANASFCDKFKLEGHLRSCNLLDCLSAADRRLLERKLLLAHHNGNACQAHLHDKRANQLLNWTIQAANNLLYIKEEGPKTGNLLPVANSHTVSNSTPLEVIPVPALLYNQKHDLLLVNQKLADLFGISEAGLLAGSKAEEKILAAADSRFVELRTALLEGSLPEIKVQLPVCLQGGEKHWMEYVERRVPEGSVPAFADACSVAVLYDIQDLKQQEERLQAREEEVNLFMDRASHDLKGPLKSMMSLYKIIEYDFGRDENVMEYVRHYHNGISRLYRILQDMLQLSRLNKTEPRYSCVNLQQMVEECLQAFSNMPGFFNILFTKQYDLPAEIMFEESLLQTIVQNLLENAIKYCAAEKPAVKIAIREEGNGILLEVSDNGIGIPADLQEKVFDRYFRATSQASGSGLGLYLLKQAVDKLKGHVSLNSQLGQGTTFTVCLPYLH